MPYPFSFYSIEEFLFLIREKTGNYYRIPSGTEWEFAARGGLESEGYCFSGSDILDEVGWFGNNKFSLIDGGFEAPNLEAKRVKQKMSNELGFYDMSGNARELVCERHDINSLTVIIDGFPNLITRGGSVGDEMEICKVHNAYLIPIHFNKKENGNKTTINAPAVGVRLALSPPH